MAERITEELLAELLEAASVDEFLDGAQESEKTLAGHLQALLEEKSLERVDVVRMANLNATFGYQVFTGTRGAGRDTILQIAFAMALTLRETNRLLHAAGVSALHCKTRRDAIIIFGLEHSYSLQKINEELYRFGEETIC